MRRSRQIRPDRPSALEARVVPSGAGLRAAMTPHGGDGGEDARDPQCEPLVGRHAGRPQCGADGLPEGHDDQRRRLDARSITRRSSPTAPTRRSMTQKITQVGTPGVETVVDHVSESGNKVTHHYTNDYPDGGSQIEASVDTFAGSRETFVKFIVTPDGSSEVVTGDTVTRGTTATTDKDYVRSDNANYHYHNVTTSRGPMSTSTTTTTFAGGSSRRDIVRSTEAEVRSTSPIP